MCSPCPQYWSTHLVVVNEVKLPGAADLRGQVVVCGNPHVGVLVSLCSLLAQALLLLLLSLCRCVEVCV